MPTTDGIVSALCFEKNQGKRVDLPCTLFICSRFRLHDSSCVQLLKVKDAAFITVS